MTRSVADTTFPAAAHVSLAVVFQVRDETLQVLAWRRERDPFRGALALPGGYLEQGESLEASITRHLATKVDVREVAHIEQLGTWSEPERHPSEWQVVTAYLGLVATDLDPALPADTGWYAVDAATAFAFDHGAIVLTARERLRAKLSYTNIGFALAPPRFTMSELRDIYVAALGHPVSATNLQRVLVRRGELAATGDRRPSGSGGGRPAAEFRFRTRGLEITDQFAVLRPPRAAA